MNIDLARVHTFIDDWRGAVFLGLVVGFALFCAIKAARHPNAFTDLNKWVNDLATTNWKMFIGGIMALGTMVFYFSSEIRCIAYKVEGACRPIDSTNFGAWLLFVAAWAGISVQQFKIKRDTYAVPSPDSERAGVPTSPPPVVPSQPLDGGGQVAVSTTVTTDPGDKR